jgi:hypothetical protein
VDETSKLGEIGGVVCIRHTGQLDAHEDGLGAIDGQTGHWPSW